VPDKGVDRVAVHAPGRCGQADVHAVAVKTGQSGIEFQAAGPPGSAGMASSGAILSGFFGWASSLRILGSFVERWQLVLCTKIFTGLESGRWTALRQTTSRSSGVNRAHRIDRCRGPH
jgi:hypothetical protein